MHLTTDEATRRSSYTIVASMATSNRNSNHARAFPRSDARHIRLCDVENEQGLPAQGRSRLKKLVHLRFATINIGTLTGRHRELAECLKNRRIDIACVQETKWRGSKSKEIGDGYKVIYHGTSTTRNGVAVVISHQFRNNVTKVSRLSDRLMSVKIEADCINANIITCYAPQTGCTDAEKEEFWDSLDAYLQAIPPDECILLGGDLNGHVGSHRNGYARCHGGHGYGIRDDDGCRILDLAEAHDLVVTNTYFKKRPTHLATYTSGGHATQIDYWMVRRRDLKLVTDTKVIPYDSVAPQHRLLVLDFRNSTNYIKPPKTGPTRIKWWKLKTYENEMKTALANLTANAANQTAEEMWNDAVQKIHLAAENILGKTKPGCRYIDKETWWWDANVQRLVKEKKFAYKTWWHTRLDADLDRYRSIKRETKRAVATAKNDHYRDLYDQLDKPGGATNVYRLAKCRSRASQDIGHVMNVKGIDSKILKDPPAVLQRWSSYYADICNEEFPHPPLLSPQPTHGPVPEITAEEVMVAIKKMKNGKATGPDDIPAEIWKLLGDHGAEFLALLFNKIVTTNKPPKIWTTSTTVPIWKGKGDVTECNNYRPIRLLSHTMKIFERVLDSRLREIVSISRNQCGFVKGCSTTDAIHAARLIVEKYSEKRRTVHMAFLDLEKAFDRVPHDLIWRALRFHGVPEMYVSWIQILYKDVSSVVRCPAGISPPFKITVGVHQGSALSPLLFILCLDTVTADIQSPHPWTLLYADDVVLTQDTRLELQNLTQTWKDRLTENGMRLNLQKTVYLESGPQTIGTITIDDQNLEKVTEFKYLGSVITSSNDSTLDTRTRVNAAWLKWRQVTGVLCDKKMPVHLKAKIYKTVVRPVALYGIECRPLTRKQRQALHTMEMRMLRWSLGLTRYDHVTNDSVRQRLGVAPIMEKAREARLRWYGHVMRKEEDSVAKTAFQLNPDGHRPRGRPLKRWMDNIREDMKDAHLNPEDVHNRTLWKRRSRKADPT